jgi:hypothetical protein
MAKPNYDDDLPEPDIRKRQQPNIGQDAGMRM